MPSRYEKIINDAKGIGLDFRINDLNEVLEVRLKGGEWRDLDDTYQAIIETEMGEMGYGVRGKKKPALSAFWNAVVKLGHTQRRHPIKDWLKQLTYEPKTPNGAVFPEPYLVYELAEYFDNPDGQFPAWLFKWGCGAVAKVFEQQRNPMLVLVSEQEMGKSYLAQWLCAIGEKYFLEGNINPDSKDARLRLTDKFIHEVGELGATTRRADAESLKEFITKKFVNDRSPYGKRPINKPAVCSFIGSVNFDGAGFLSDPTGSSRFLACQIDSINFDYSQAIDPKALWAEFMWFYTNAHARKPWELSPSERTRRDEINAQFEVVNAIDDVVDEFLEVTGEFEDFLSTLDIRSHLSLHYRFNSEGLFNRELARSLHRYRKDGVSAGREPFKSGKGHHRGYRGLKRRER